MTTLVMQIPRKEESATHTNSEVQRGFDSCRGLPFSVGEIDLDACSEEDLRNAYYSKLAVASESPFFKEGVDMFLEEMWKEISSRRVEFTDSSRLESLKVV